MEAGTTIALLAALLWGVADFIGGMLTRRHATIPITFLSQLSSGVLLAAALLAAVAAGRLDAPPAATLAWGAVAGICGGLGIAVFYAALAAGPMSLVAPISACGVLVPIVVAFAGGEVPGAVAVAGIVVAVVGVVLVARTPGGTEGGVARPALPRRALALALLAAIGFGAFFVTVDHATTVADASGLWVAAGARAGSVPMLALLVAATGVRRLRLPARDMRATVALGALDVSANAAIAAAVAVGNLAVVSVTGSLYPAVTVLLAWLVLHERLAPTQRSGVALVLVAVPMMAS